MSNGRPVRGGTLRLLGRRSESALLDGVVAAVRHGDSRTLLLRGEAGVGKTALLEYLVSAASDLQVVRASGVESEMELAFASLHQLCGPMLDRLGLLPLPQRHALEIAFGLSEGAAPDRFRVGLAVLTLLSVVAGERPLLCVVDDAQWLDRASALTVAFVARRLLAEPVALVFAARETPEELQGVPQFEVRGLADEDARALLVSEAQFALDERVRDQIVAESRGNPLALLELPRGMSAAELALGFGYLGAQTLSGRIEESFRRRLEELPDKARLFVLVAAAEPIGDPLLLWSAAERLGINAAAAAETDGLLAIGERVSFRHPLVRSAVYRSADVTDRQAVHLALAETTDREADPDRRAWHRALATAGVDEEVAKELERSAGRAQARGGLAATAAFLQRAVALTEDRARRADRALAAADASFQAGGFDAALQLVATADAGPLDEFQRARVVLLRGRVAFASGLGGNAPGLLLEAARRLEPLDLELARETYLAAWGATTRLGQPDVVLEISRAALALPPRPGTPHPLDLLLEGLARLTTDGHAAAAPILRRAAKSLTSIPLEDVLRWGSMAAAPSTLTWDFDGLRAIAERQVQLVRDAGALAELPIHLSALSLTREWSGDFAGAESLIAESDSVAAATGSGLPPFSALRLWAMQGKEAQASAEIANVVEQAAATGLELGVSWVHSVAAVLYNGLGWSDEAVAAARQAVANPLNPWGYMSALPELVEAAARQGDTELARDALERLAETTQPAGTDFALGIEARSRALLSDGETAECLYQEAIERLGRTPLRPELARADLLYGEWLRRRQRRLDARAHLRAAHGAFTSIGMDGFADRARTELLATGENVRRRSVQTRDELTTQERQIAQMAGNGLSNPEIGTRLFLSPRTVEWHLRKVFIKLGISSRKELRGALREAESESISP
jgi:DNA-binding CsgD family transcriptional regulator/tetratricopeptide (TPR) repeat protein